MAETKYWQEERIAKGGNIHIGGCSFCGIEMDFNQLTYEVNPIDEEQIGTYLCEEHWHAYLDEKNKLESELWCKYFKIYFLSAQEQAEQNILNFSAQLEKKSVHGE